tara:strand:+ start:373 stop:657 length:285 start_codon:yes stop_codon:yes gene_type:complete
MRFDRLYDVRWDLIRLVTFAWLTRLDQATGNKRPAPADVVMAAAINFILVVERFGVNPREVLTVADRVIRRADDVSPTYTRAIRGFLKEELPDA